MAEEKKPSFPMIPVVQWWKLREKFKQSIPGVVTDNYLSAALGIQPISARKNILPYLKAIGLIDEEGKTLELAKAWRDDAQYAEVCKKIREKIYPNELMAAVPNPAADRNAVERWFANHTGSGVSAVGKMAAFYITLSEADISKKPEKKPPKEKAPMKKKPPAKEIKVKVPDTTKAEVPPASEEAKKPSVYINLQIHISSDATPDQIDKIFESMAKYIYKK
jgi:hypothetical protein